MLERVRRAEEVPAGADLLVGAERERVLVDLERLELVLQHPQDLDVDDVLLVARHEAALEPAGGVHHEVRAGEEGRQHRHQRLVGRLGVGRLARREPAAASPRQVEVARDLAGAEQADRRLRRAEARRARLHVGVREERAEHDRAARLHELGERDPRQRLGHLLHERGRDRHRRHRAHEEERRA